MTDYQLDKNNEVYKYKAVPHEQRHPDYQSSGVAPLIGHQLSKIAEEDSDRGALAEGILRTGEHSLLPILNDRLAGENGEEAHPSYAEYDADHNLKSGPIDWHHAPRAIAIDKAFNKVLGPQLHPGPFGSPVELAPVSPRQVFHYWNSGHHVYPTRRTTLKEIRKVVPDAKDTDLYHSLNRLIHNEDGVDEPSIEGIEAGNQRLRRWVVNKVFNSHKYPDTRPVGKRTPVFYKADMKDRNWLKSKMDVIKAKYAITKSGSKGMVDQVSPLAAFGVWRKPNEFSTSLPSPYDTNKSKPVAKSDVFTPARDKINPPVKPFDQEKKQKKLSLDYVRKLFKKMKSKTKKK